MGLDQWLIAKMTKKPETDEHTGVCGGLFGIIPTTVADNVEIGYWRKAYDQDKLICDVAAGKTDEEGNLPITANEVDEIIEEAQRILKKHKFDKEDGYDLTRDDMRFESDEETFMSKEKWKDTIKFFKKAKKILKEDPEAKIFYHVWY